MAARIHQARQELDDNGRQSSRDEQPARLLVAEDEHLVAGGLVVNLRELGYEVVGPASDGQEAIDLCCTEEPDLALLDIRMPRLNGLTAAETIFGSLGIPVVILSAYSDPEYVNNGNKVGVFGYLLKPATQDQLRVGITVAWGRFLDYAYQTTEIETLKDRLEQRKIIEQAKWLLVQTRGLDEPEALRLLQQQARLTRKRLAEVARTVIENRELLEEL